MKKQKQKLKQKKNCIVINKKYVNNMKFWSSYRRQITAILCCMFCLKRRAVVGWVKQLV